MDRRKCLWLLMQCGCCIVHDPAPPSFLQKTAKPAIIIICKAHARKILKKADTWDFFTFFRNQARSQDSRFFYSPIRWPATNTKESSRRLHVHVWPAIHNDISSSITLDSINITKTSHLIHNYYFKQLLCFEGPLVIIELYYFNSHSIVLCWCWRLWCLE